MSSATLIDLSEDLPPASEHPLGPGGQVHEHNHDDVNCQFDPNREVVFERAQDTSSSMIPLQPERQAESANWNPYFTYNVSYNADHSKPPQSSRTEMSSATDLKADRSFENYRLHAVNFELTEGDTMVFIDLPNTPKDHRKLVDCHGFAYKSQSFRVHSDKLLATGSAKLKELLSPTKQFRTQRRRKVVNKLPDGVKYVLDLTPPSEGDELVFEMTELSLTPGIINWWAADRLFDVELAIVGGHDDICSCGRLPRSPTADTEARSPEQPEKEQQHQNDSQILTQIPPRPEQLLRLKAMDRNEILETPPYLKIPDYCPIRHCNSIIRLLMLIEGKSVLFDSANRVWTMLAVAKIFDCASVVRESITNWMVQRENSKFIEILPEEALRIGWALEIPNVTQAAFRILVNEMALDEAATDAAAPRGDKQTTIFGRRRGDVPDELHNLVQHAARAFVERMSGLYAQIRNHDIFDFWEVGEWNKLRAMEQLLKQEDGDRASFALKKVQELMQQIRLRLSDTFDNLARLKLTVELKNILDTMDCDRATYIEPRHYEDLKDILKKFNTVQLLLCPFIYNEMEKTFEKSLFESRREHFKAGRPILLGPLVAGAETAVLEVVRERPGLASSPEWKMFHVAFKDHAPGDFPTTPFLAMETPLVRLAVLGAQVRDAVNPFAQIWMRHVIEPPLNVTRHMLLTLTENELKYLPLWAGGRDDGTGGVFESYVPPTDFGPNGPGPAYHTGHTAPSASSISDSLMEDIRGMKLMGSTTAGSVDVHDSVSTVYGHDQVIVDDRSIVSEDFASEDSEYKLAQYAVPAEHQSMGMAVDALVESVTDSATDSATLSDDQYESGRHTPVASSNDLQSDSEDSMVFV